MMKRKNALIAAASLLLVAVIAVGGTLAYFTDTTAQRDNVFTTGIRTPTGIFAACGLAILIILLNFIPAIVAAGEKEKAGGSRSGDA